MFAPPVLAVVESSCLVDTWAVTVAVVEAVARHAPDRPRDLRGALRALTAESARGTDPRALHRAAWSLLDADDHEAVARCPEALALPLFRRDDALGRAACRAVQAHLRAGDRVVVVSDLVPALAAPLADTLGVPRVVCGAPTPDLAGRWPAAVPDVLIGAAAARALEQVAADEGFPIAQVVAYGRGHRDRDLLRAAGQAVELCFSGHLHRGIGLAGSAICVGSAPDEAAAARVAPLVGRALAREYAVEAGLLPAHAS